MEKERQTHNNEEEEKGDKDPEGNREEETGKQKYTRTDGVRLTERHVENLEQDKLPQPTTVGKTSVCVRAGVCFEREKKEKEKDKEHKKQNRERERETKRKRKSERKA